MTVIFERSNDPGGAKMMNLPKYACVALLILGASLKVDAELERSKATGRQGTLAGMVLDPNKAGFRERRYFSKQMDLSKRSQPLMTEVIRLIFLKANIRFE